MKTVTAPTDHAAAATRRRGDELLNAIYHAVLDELGDVGYQGLTIEGVAKRAQTGKAAIYRRWADKEELVSCTLDALLPSPEALPDTGSIRDDLVTVFTSMLAFFTSPTGAALQRIFADTARTESTTGPSLVEIKHRVVGRRQEMLATLLRRGVERGQVRPDAVCQRVLDTGPSLIATRCMIGGAITEADVIGIVDDVLVPLIRT